MEQDCDACFYWNKDDDEEPCVSCKGTTTFSNFTPKKKDINQLLREKLGYVVTEQPDAVKQPLDKYPQYYKSTFGYPFVDVYAVHQLFDIKDPSGALQHASKKILLSGVRTGGKSMYKDIEEARDTLTRWLDLNKHE